ncbi:MAG TPA: DUF1778 domain-containing protein [Terriglobales bacterium]
MALRLRQEDRKRLLRAAAIENTDLTSFMVQHALRIAGTVIEKSERVQRSERDTLRVLDLIENPPAPTPRLLRPARSFQSHR